MHVPRTRCMWTKNYWIMTNISNEYSKLFFPDCLLHFPVTIYHTKTMQKAIKFLFAKRIIPLELNPLAAYVVTIYRRLVYYYCLDIGGQDYKNGMSKKWNLNPSKIFKGKKDLNSLLLTAYCFSGVLSMSNCWCVVYFFSIGVKYLPINKSYCACTRVVQLCTFCSVLHHCLSEKQVTFEAQFHVKPFKKLSSPNLHLPFWP